MNIVDKAAYGSLAGIAIFAVVIAQPEHVPSVWENLHAQITVVANCPVAPADATDCFSAAVYAGNTTGADIQLPPGKFSVRFEDIPTIRTKLFGAGVDKTELDGRHDSLRTVPHNAPHVEDPSDE